MVLKPGVLDTRATFSFGTRAGLGKVRRSAARRRRVGHQAELIGLSVDAFCKARFSERRGSAKSAPGLSRRAFQLHILLTVPAYWVTLANVTCSAAMVVLSPCPVRTTVSAGSVSSRSRMEVRMVG